MIALRRPGRATIAAFQARMQRAPYSYREVGATREGGAPDGYAVDRSAVTIGRGAAAFSRAREALAGFRHYDDPGGRVRLLPPRPPFEPEREVFLLARHLGVWTLNACRIVYVIDEPDRFGFGYGTLEHAVHGEERFLLCLVGDEVRFELLAFSRPAHPLIRLGGPVTRRFQRDEARAYGRALARCARR